MKVAVLIGMEVHLQLRTQSKMFCRCQVRFGAPPNSLVCPVCMGLPGSLPVPNREALLKALTAALAFGCTLPEVTKFDRKNYYYPDLPKGYQISQYDQPLGQGGTLEIVTEEGRKMVRLTLLTLATMRCCRWRALLPIRTSSLPARAGSACVSRRART